MKSKKFFITLLLSCGLLSHGLMAQEETGSKWYWGVAGGVHSSRMSFSDIDKEYFPTNKNRYSGVASLFLQGEFGRQKQFGIRPQVSILNRGGKLTEIYNSGYGTTTEDINYTLKANYLDVRVPLIYNFGKASSSVRPYVFVAPVVGFVIGGNIKLQEDFTDQSYLGYDLDVSDANMASTYVAGQAGVGLKFALPVGDRRCYLGIEASYELGLTDTYGSKEKDGEAYDVAQLFTSNYQINGTRKLSGFEVQAVLSIPFGKEKKKTVQPAAPVVTEYVEPQIVEEVVEEKPCYTLEEIITLMAKNESVEGKTICAVDAIHFDTAKSEIKPESFDYLDKLAKTLIRMDKCIEVKGHTDNVGADDFNMNLSKERAKAVVEYLVKKGMNRKKLSSSYYGKTRPLTSNDTEEGRAMNRRVEFTILNCF